MTEIKVKRICRSKFVHMDDIRSPDGTVLPHFKEVFMNMLRNKVTMEVEILISEYEANREKRTLDFGDAMVEFCDKHCTGFWSRMDREPEEIIPTHRSIDRMTPRKFHLTLVTLFEKPEDADYFVSHFALMKKLESD